jgi:hypothetical protein
MLVIYKNSKISDLIKIHPVGAELFHADGRTNMRNGNRRFSQFWEHALNLL